MKLKDLAIDHPYYASESNYFSNDAKADYPVWADFYEEWNDFDVDLNLVYRWDIKKREESDRYYMELFIIQQRKGIYMPIMVHYVDEKDIETIVPFLKKHKAKIEDIWNPIK